MTTTLLIIACGLLLLFFIACLIELVSEIGQLHNAIRDLWSDNNALWLEVTSVRRQAENAADELARKIIDNANRQNWQ